MLNYSIRELYKEKDDTNVSFFGRVRKIRNLGKILFILIEDQGDIIQVVADNNQKKVKTGEHVNIVGTLHEYEGKKEVHAIEIELAGHNNLTSHSIEKNSDYFSEHKLNALFIRSRIISEIHGFFVKQDFFQTHSPTIVSNWVEGQTGAFKTQFYDDDCYLSISNMIYHQILLINRFTRIYEIAKIFRKEEPSTIHRLAEFTIIDIGLAYRDVDYLMLTVENLIKQLHSALLNMNRQGLQVSEEIYFESIKYSELVRRAGAESFTGSQFPKIVRDFLKKEFQSFVWVTGFPDDKRPFFVKSVDGICRDCQLWYKGKIYLAAGGERETDLERIKNKILSEGKDLSNYDFYLSFYKKSVPPMCGIGMGIERFLATIIPGTNVADFIPFPRYKNHFIP
jgi:aspartyl/asparaginyl-tRNA synthetase